MWDVGHSITVHVRCLLPGTSNLVNSLDPFQRVDHSPPRLELWSAALEYVGPKTGNIVSIEDEPNSQ